MYSLPNAIKFPLQGLLRKIYGQAEKKEENYVDVYARGNTTAFRRFEDRNSERVELKIAIICACRCKLWGSNVYQFYSVVRMSLKSRGCGGKWGKLHRKTDRKFLIPSHGESINRIIGVNAIDPNWEYPSCWGRYCMNPDARTFAIMDKSSVHFDMIMNLTRVVEWYRCVESIRHMEGFARSTVRISVGQLPRICRAVNNIRAARWDLRCWRNRNCGDRGICKGCCTEGVYAAYSILIA